MITFFEFPDVCCGVGFLEVAFAVKHSQAWGHAVYILTFLSSVFNFGVYLKTLFKMLISDARGYSLFMLCSSLLLMIPQTELALWGSGALNGGEAHPAARASAAVNKMILANIL